MFKSFKIINFFDTEVIFGWKQTGAESENSS